MVLSPETLITAAIAALTTLFVTVSPIILNFLKYRDDKVATERKYLIEDLARARADLDKERGEHTKERDSLNKEIESLKVRLTERDSTIATLGVALKASAKLNPKEIT